FFFQAEDGIRDRNVTGVQTCALPISFPRFPSIIIWLIKRVTSFELYRGSGMTSRLGTGPLRGISSPPFLISMMLVYFFGFFAPYLEWPCCRPSTPAISSSRRTLCLCTPGKSFTRHPRIKTTLCSWRLWPIPGIYAVTSILFDRRTRAYLRNAEFGFFGVKVPTRVHTPRFCGEFKFVKRFLKLL